MKYSPQPAFDFGAASKINIIIVAGLDIVRVGERPAVAKAMAWRAIARKMVNLLHL